MKELLSALILNLTDKLKFSVQGCRLFVKKSLSKVLGEEILENVFGGKKPENSNQKRERCVSHFFYQVPIFARWIFLLHHFVNENGEVVG